MDHVKKDDDILQDIKRMLSLPRLSMDSVYADILARKKILMDASSSLERARLRLKAEGDYMQAVCSHSDKTRCNYCLYPQRF